MSMDIKVQKEGTVITLVLAGKFDAVSAVDFDNALKEIALAPGTGLLLNLSGVEYISSAGLRGILLAAKKVRATQGELALCAPTQQVQKVLNLSGFDRICRIFPSKEEALKAMAGEGKQ